MNGSLEREIKLRVNSAGDARAAIVAAGGTLLRDRRLQADAILDSADSMLRIARCALRVRIEPDRCFLTYKGQPLPSAMKLREELETGVEDPRVLFAVLERLGFTVRFRYEKYREEFALGDVIVAIDETPVGTFIEIEGSDEGIGRTAAALGYGPEHFIVSSYRSLFEEQCLAAGIASGDMVFGS
jgi:adenylate cyclase, class 2